MGNEETIPIKEEIHINFPQPPVEETPHIEIDPNVNTNNVKIKKFLYGVIPAETLKKYIETDEIPVIKPEHLRDGYVFKDFDKPDMLNNVKMMKTSKMQSISISSDIDSRIYDPDTYIYLTITLDPPQSGIPVNWLKYDPDDPANSSVIDPNGSASGDNRASSSDFYFSYYDSSTDGNGQASAVFRFNSFYGGDDITLWASTSVGLIGTSRIARWKKMEIEYDIMLDGSGGNFVAQTSNLENIFWAFEGYNESHTAINYDWCTYTTPSMPGHNFSPFTHQQYTTTYYNPPRESLESMHTTQAGLGYPIHLLTIDDHDWTTGSLQYAQGIALNDHYSYVYVGRLQNAGQTSREKWLLPHEIAHQIGQNHCDLYSQEGFGSGVSWSTGDYVYNTGKRCMMYQASALPQNAQDLARFGEYHIRAIRGVQTIN